MHLDMPKSAEQPGEWLKPQHTAEHCSMRGCQKSAQGSSQMRRIQHLEQLRLPWATEEGVGWGMSGGLQDSRRAGTLPPMADSAAASWAAARRRPALSKRQASAPSSRHAADPALSSASLLLAASACGALNDTMGNIILLAYIECDGHRIVSGSVSQPWHASF